MSHVYSNEEILMMFTDCHFGEFTSDNKKGLFTYLRTDIAEGMDGFWMADGASKCVIGWSDQDWVVKIPFIGSHGEEGCSECMEDSYTDTEGVRHSSVWYRPEDGELCEFGGACNSINDWDYCRTELENYERAVDAGVDEFFAETIFIGYAGCEHHPIYLQKKVDSLGMAHSYEELESEPEDSKEQAKSISGTGMGQLDWMSVLIIMKEYGNDTAQRLVNFIDACHISDLHSSNMGTCKGKWMLIDYSGFEEGY